MAIARNISINSETYELEPSKGQRVYVGTCSTAAATNPKVCTVEDFPVDENNKPYTGTEIVVKFTATNTSTSTTPELNVNGTGAIRIWYNNAVLASAKSAYAGYANRYMRYVYDGTYWVFMGHSVDNNSTYSNVALGQGYAVQNNSAASATITAALGSYALTANGIVSVKFLYDVPANATLNINGKGAKAIYNKDAAITAGVIKSGDTATFIYNTYYMLISVDRWQDKQDAISDLATIRSGASLGATALQSYTETDPTVPAWAKQSTKPSYTASEISGLANVATSGSYNDLQDKPNIPTAVTVDSTITQNGTNPVQGSAIYSALEGKAGLVQYQYESDLLDNTSQSTGTLGYEYDNERLYFWDNANKEWRQIAETTDLSSFVRTTRKINNKSLSSNITLNASDVGADVFVVNIASNGNDGYTCDKTNAEIYAAWQAGRNIVLIRDSEFLYNLNILPSQTFCEFGGDEHDDIGGYSHYSIFTRDGQQNVRKGYVFFQEYLQSGTNIKTINNLSLLGSGNLTASDVGALPSSTHIPADQVQSNWDETDTSSKAYIQNKPSFKTINGESILGSGDIEAGSGDVATAFTITITSTTIEVQPMTGALMTVGTDVSFQVV